MPYMTCTKCDHPDHLTGVENHPCTAGTACDGTMVITDVAPPRSTFGPDHGKATEEFRRQARERTKARAAAGTAPPVLAQAVADTGAMGADSVSGEVQRPPGVPRSVHVAAAQRHVPRDVNGKPIDQDAQMARYLGIPKAELERERERERAAAPPPGPDDALTRAFTADHTRPLGGRPRPATPPTLDLRASGLVPPADEATVTVADVAAESGDALPTPAIRALFKPESEHTPDERQALAEARALEVPAMAYTPELYEGKGKPEDMRGLPLEALSAISPAILDQWTTDVGAALEAAAAARGVTYRPTRADARAHAIGLLVTAAGVAAGSDLDAVARRVGLERYDGGGGWDPEPDHHLRTRIMTAAADPACELAPVMRTDHDRGDEDDGGGTFEEGIRAGWTAAIGAVMAIIEEQRAYYGPDIFDHDNATEERRTARRFCWLLDVLMRRIQTAAAED